MNYNVNYEICTIIFLIMFFTVSYTKRRLEDFQSKMYRIFLIVCSFNTLLDVLTCYSDYYYNAIPVGLNYALNTVFLIAQCAIPIIFTLYIYFKAEQIQPQNNRLLHFAVIPAVTSSILVLSSPVTHLFFYFDETGYHHGPLHSWLYVNAVVYAVGTALYAIYVHKIIRWSQSILAITLIIVTLTPTIVQFFLPNYMLSGLGTALAIFIMYLTNENSMIYVDATTTALNRQALTHHIKESKKRNVSEKIFVVALDNFKIINEIYGIAGGNRLMCMLVEALQKVYSSSNVYRFGGDTFIVTLKDTIDSTQELSIIQTILSQNWKLYDSSTEIKISACVCLLHSAHHSEDSIADAIEYAIQIAKQKGKGQFIEITENNASEILRRKAIEQSIFSSIERNTFEVHYQPIWDTKEKKFHSLEALARLYVPEYGYVSPEEFIRIAEQNGSILKIGLLVLEDVCRFYTRCHLKDYGIDFIEVNLSVVQCMQDSIYDDIAVIMERYGVTSDQINLEITESAAAYSEERLIQNMEKMSVHGISFSLDDYGSGYSNINYLVDLPFSIVKIDKYVVWSAMKNETSHIILSNIIAMFKKIKLDVVAEGIEDLAMADQVTTMGADYLQGYYYSKPLPKEQLLKLLKTADN